MSDYEALTIAPLCNADAGLIGDEGREWLGRRDVRGLPFDIGDAEASQVALFGPDGHSEPQRIAIGRAAVTLTFAHSLASSRLPEGDLPGATVAVYRIHFADGETHDIPIRERFEIGVTAHSTDMFRVGAPFLALPQADPPAAPRDVVERDGMGRALTDVGTPPLPAFSLFPWRNPRPNVEIAAVEVRPTDRAVVLCGICVGMVDEDPLRADARRAVVVELPQPEDADRPFAVEVAVDRGTATLAHPLPRDPEAFLTSDTAGWGEAKNPASSPAYSEIAATPSATVRVELEGEEVGHVRFGELTAKGELKPSERLTVRAAETGRAWVHTRVVDAATGRPMPCRIHFRSPDGVPYQPHGHHSHLNAEHDTWHVDVGGDLRLDQATYAYIDGRCQGWLPTGRVLVDVARGFEYQPLRAEIDIKPGQRELELRLDRWTDMNAQGWYSGDTHVHFLSGDGANVEAAGEDLNVVNVLQSQWGSLFTNTEDFIGRPRVSDDGRTIVYVSQENRQHFLGHLTLLGLTDPVMPWCSDGPTEAEPGGSMETTLSHWADACHAQGGTVVIPHLPFPNGEPAALIATGRADAVEMLTQGPFAHTEYYRYLNGGYRLPLVGGTDKMSSEVPVGLYRTYVRLPSDEPFSYESWCANMAAGRTFLSGGPIISLRVEGHEPGDTLHLDRNGGSVTVEASVESILPVHSLQIVREGEVVAEAQASQGARQLRLSETLEFAAPTWLAARCGGPSYFDAPEHHDGWHRQRFAHTSPVYVADGDAEWSMWSDATAQYMLTLIDGSLDYIRHRSTQYPAGHASHHHGEADHQAFLEGPFHEAREAIHRRMHQLGIPH
ncbi:MAG: CehA/McbA family metallohydrolase [Chloroflexota bacterium]|nr:CehA/McbA family metallohydrolase [Chloroflexota bacterium]